MVKTLREGDFKTKYKRKLLLRFYRWYYVGSINKLNIFIYVDSIRATKFFNKLCQTIYKLRTGMFYFFLF